MKHEYFSFKKLLSSFFWSFVPFYLIIGILSLLNVVTANLNGKQYYGVIGFVVILFMLILCSFIFSVVCFILLNLGTFIRNFLFDKKSKE